MCSLTHPDLEERASRCSTDVARQRISRQLSADLENVDGKLSIGPKWHVAAFS